MCIIFSEHTLAPNTVSINGSKITLWHKKWVVIDCKTWSKTQVDVSGGSRYVAPGGYYYPPQISSCTTEQQEIWVRDEQGKEVPMRLNNGAFPVRVGQTVIVFAAKVSGQSWLVELHNIDTDKRKWMLSSWEHLLIQSNVMPRPLWLQLPFIGQALGLVGIVYLCGAIAGGLVQAVAPPSQSNPMFQQVMSLQAKAFNTTHLKLRQEFLSQVNTLQVQAVQLRRDETKRDLLRSLWTCGVISFGALSGLYLRVHRYRVRLEGAVRQLGQSLTLERRQARSTR